MDKEKQIEEMAKDICKLADCALLECMPDKHCTSYKYAQRAVDKGYRKSSDVAREIFEVIEEMCFDFCGNFNHLYFAELKKKYKSEDFIPAPPHTCQVEIPKYYESIINQVFPENEDTQADRF